MVLNYLTADRDREGASMTARPYPLRVLIVDPNAFSRGGLRALLMEDERFAIVGDTGDDATPLAQQLSPDLIVVDPQINGQLDLQVITNLACTSPDSRIIVFTEHFDPDVALDTLPAGVRAYYLKAGADGEFLREALALVGRFGASVMEMRIYDQFRDQSTGELVLHKPGPEYHKLSDRELEVVRLVVAGLDNKQIGRQLNISNRTVLDHITHASDKMGALSRTHLGVLAARQGLG